MLPAPQCFYALLPWFRLQLVARASKEEEVYSYTDLGGGLALTCGSLDQRAMLPKSTSLDLI